MLKVQEQACWLSVIFKNLDNFLVLKLWLLWVQLIDFDRNLSNEPGVLGIVLDHLVHRCHAVFLAHVVERLENLILWDGVAVEENSLPVVDACEVFECPSVHSNSFT